MNMTNCMFDFLSPILSSKGGILSAWSFPWGGLCPGGILSGGIMGGGGRILSYTHMIYAQSNLQYPIYRSFNTQSVHRVRIFG